jgi:hypothetical protein
LLIDFVALPLEALLLMLAPSFLVGGFFLKNIHPQHGAPPKKLYLSSLVSLRID